MGGHCCVVLFCFLSKTPPVNKKYLIPLFSLYENNFFRRKMGELAGLEKDSSKTGKQKQRQFSSH